MSSTPLPDYCMSHSTIVPILHDPSHIERPIQDAMLQVPEGAPMQEIRDAYMRQASPPSDPESRLQSTSTNNPPPSAALATHPDGIPLDSSDHERHTLTCRYHLINDAYYNLSDATRRMHYDAQRMSSTPPTPGATGKANGDDDQQLREDAQFKDVFEGEMRDNDMAEDGTNTPKTAFWSLIGGVTGGTLAFIITGPPGAPAGIVLGNAAGKIRDARGKSVYEVYKLLDHEEREDMLHELRKKLFGPFAGE